MTSKYDVLADRYEEIYFYVAEVGEQLVAVAEPPPRARLLDVGAGRGAVARAALARGCAVTAVDASADMVARLARDHPDLTVSQGDAAALTFPDASFDVVTAGFVVQVLPAPEVALAEFRRVLAPGGTVALSLERQTVGRLGWLHELNLEFFGGGGGAEPQGVPDAVAALPTDRAVAFRERFFQGAQRMHDDGGIVLEFGATLHRATAE